MEKTLKEKTALVSIGLKVGFTAFKFAAYPFTGSVAILAEAWHSFSDIVTSCLVYFSVRKNEEKKPQDKNVSVPGWLKWFLKIHPEYAVAYTIGIFLFFVSVGLFRKTATAAPHEIQNVVITGILFIVFSFFSYAISKYQTYVGMKENSAALVSDGMHSKADMISSLLVGFSLLIYKLGFNIDGFVAFLIAFCIFLFSIEIIINAAIAQIKGKEYSFRYRSYQFFKSRFEKEKRISLQGGLDKKFKLGLRESKLVRLVSRYGKTAVFLAAILFYLSTCFYTVNPSEAGMIERFGEPIAEKGSIPPGLHFKFPWPIDRAVKIEAKKIQKINIGNVTDENTFALIWTKEHGAEEAFLSGDNNLFYPYFVFHYKVKDVFNFIYKNRNSEELLDNIAHRVISHIFSTKSFYEIVTYYRKELETDILTSVQEELDVLDSGLEIVAVNIKDIHPPVFIAHSFEDVIAAYQDKEKMFNDAIAYRNHSIPQARAEAAKQIRNAEAYVIDKINYAQGESERFKLQRESYLINPYVTSRKFYLKNLGEGMEESRKFILDLDAGIPELWLDFNKMFKMQEKK